MLQNKAMLATLTISQWTARRHDKAVSDEVDKSHGAKDAGRYNKLLVDKSALEPMNQVASAARLYHYRMTLPWGDNGDRLLPSMLYLDYTKAVREYKDEFNRRAAAFSALYPSLVQSARQRLGTMYEPKDYPANICDRFEFKVGFSLIPDAKDFRVEVDAEHAEEIKRDITAAVEERQKQAVKDCWTRVREIVSRIEERCSAEKPIIRDSLMENTVQLLDVLPALNITGDPELKVISDEVRARLVHNPDALRTNDSIRDQTARAAAEILAKMPWS